MNRRDRVLRRLLIAATGLLGLTAVPGGVLLLLGRSAPPVEMLAGSAFESFVVPGLVLVVVVGGSALLSTALLLRRSPHGPLGSAISGLLVMCFEFVQVVSIGSPVGPSRNLQLSYFFLGLLIVAAAIPLLGAPRPAIPLARPAPP